MKFLNKYIFFLLAALLWVNVFCAQTSNLDSLYTDYSKTTNPILKLDKALKLVLEFGNNDQHNRAFSLIKELETSKVDATEINLKKGVILLAKSLLYKTLDSNNASMLNAQLSLQYLVNYKHYYSEAQSMVVMNYFYKGQFDSCIAYGNRVITLKQSKNISSQIDVMLCMGRSYDFIGDRKKGVALTLEAIEIAKGNDKTIKLAELYVSLSAIYKGESLNFSKKYSLLAADVLKKSNNQLDRNTQSSLNTAYLMIGNVYYDFLNLDSAEYYYKLCKEGSKKTNDQQTYFAAIGNLGNIAVDKGDFSGAIQCNMLVLEGYKKLDLPSQVAVSFGSLADLYKDLKDYKNAIKYYDSALVITKQIQSADDFIYNYKGLSQTYEMMGNDKLAFKYYKLYKLWNDSINNNQNSKKINALELDFKYKNEQHEKDLIQKNKDAVTQQKITQQKYTIWAAVLGGLCLIIFLGFAVKSNIQKKKTNKQLQDFNKEISEQKNIIEQKNHEITDSITYASRIQKGVIPDDEELKELLPNHFVFFKPRDIVSGDFYWATKVKSKTTPHIKRTVVAVVDCTGHGVPGAFMSLVGNTLLNQTINRSAISNPAQSLDYINVQLPKIIKSKVSTGTIKDGMEIAMCDFNFDTLSMQFAGANSNIYVVRKGELQIYKGDKQPIGESYSGTIINYTNQIISLQKNDCVYLISDGYADQFGGEKGKKFKYKPLENLFCTIANMDMHEQQAIISKTFDAWKSSHEQVDDVLIMGIKI
jgi:serine phosphatase RsbU (regulator of sigma subunit)